MTMDFKKKLDEALAGAGSEEVQEILERVEADYKKAREAALKLPGLTAKVIIGSLDELVKLFNILFAIYQDVHSRVVGKPLPFEHPMPEDIRLQIGDRVNEITGALELIPADSSSEVLAAATSVAESTAAGVDEIRKLVGVINNLARMGKSREG